MISYLRGVSKIESILLSSNPLVQEASEGDLHVSKTGIVIDSDIVKGSVSSVSG